MISVKRSFVSFRNHISIIDFTAQPCCAREVLKMIKTTLKIDGMMCSMCESHINDVIRANFDIKKVTSSHSKGETVVLSEHELDGDKLASVIADTGYELKDVMSVEEEQKKGGLHSLFHRK